jgi:hypothetical protein
LAKAGGASRRELRLAGQPYNFRRSSGGCQLLGWVERSETHSFSLQNNAAETMGFTPFYPSYSLADFYPVCAAFQESDYFGGLINLGFDKRR